MVQDPLVVYNPVRGSANLNMICLGVEVGSHHYMFVSNLFSLGFVGYGIIFDMDWLEE